MKQKYSSYKDSGVEWIGQIPSHWEVRKFKFLFSEKKHTLNPNLGAGAISFGRVVFKKDEGIPEETKLSYQEVLSGEFLINPLNLNFDLKSLRIAKSEIDVVVSGGYIVLTLSKDNHKNYYKHLLYAFDILQMKSLGNGVRQTISFGHLSTENLILPPNDEQIVISNYLDQKTSQIDTLVSLTEKKIELLKEKRTSLINEAVTKGLDKTAKMKDSGVEWIGEIPIHWEIRPLKTITDVRPSNVDKHIYPDEIQVELCNYTDVYKNDFIDKRTPLKVGSCTETEFSRFCLKKGDVIITKDSETSDDIGIPCLITEDLTNVVCGYHLTLLRPISVVGGFLFRVFQTQYIKSYFENESNGITRVALGKSSIESTFIVYPPLPEQQQIVDYINHHTSEIDKLISIEQRRIDTLKEYRQSLISEVVTGKVKVSNS